MLLGLCSARATFLTVIQINYLLVFNLNWGTLKEILSYKFKFNMKRVKKIRMNSMQHHTY